MRSRTLGALAAVSLSAALAAIPAGALGGARQASSHTVTVHDVHFRPGTLNVNRGDSVTWVWRERGNEHNVTFRGFRSRTKTSGSYTVRFTHSGAFPYRCTIHEAEGMRGKIIVH
jgi:plastocyanin